MPEGCRSGPRGHPLVMVSDSHRNVTDHYLHCYPFVVNGSVTYVVCVCAARRASISVIRPQAIRPVRVLPDVRTLSHPRRTLVEMEDVHARSESGSSSSSRASFASAVGNHSVGAAAESVIHREEYRLIRRCDQCVRPASGRVALLVQGDTCDVGPRSGLRRDRQRYRWHPHAVDVG